MREEEEYEKADRLDTSELVAELRTGWETRSFKLPEIF